MKQKTNIIENIKSSKCSFNELIKEFDSSILQVNDIVLGSKNENTIEQWKNFIVNNIINKKKILQLNQLKETSGWFISLLINEAEFNDDIMLFLAKHNYIHKPYLFIRKRPHISEIEKYISQKQDNTRKNDILEISYNISLTSDEWDYIDSHFTDANIILALHQTSKEGYDDIRYNKNVINWKRISSFIDAHPESKYNLYCFLDKHELIYRDMLEDNIDNIITFGGIQYILTIDDIELLLKTNILPNISDSTIEHHLRVMSQYIRLYEYNEYIYQYYITNLINIFNEDILTKHKKYLKQFLGLFVDIIYGNKNIDKTIFQFLYDVYNSVHFQDILQIKVKILKILSSDSIFLNNIEKDWDILHPAIKKEYIKFLLSSNSYSFE